MEPVLFISANASESDKRDLMKELETMKQLKPHPHVIKLLGCVMESGEPTMIQPPVVSYPHPFRTHLGRFVLWKLIRFVLSSVVSYPN